MYEIGHTKNAINVIKNESYVEKTAYEMKYQLCYKWNSMDSIDWICAESTKIHTFLICDGRNYEKIILA